jgi:hypothetical protein
MTSQVFLTQKQRATCHESGLGKACTVPSGQASAPLGSANGRHSTSSTSPPTSSFIMHKLWLWLTLRPGRSCYLRFKQYGTFKIHKHCSGLLNFVQTCKKCVCIYHSIQPVMCKMLVVPGWRWGVRLGPSRGWTKTFLPCRPWTLSFRGTDSPKVQTCCPRRWIPDLGGEGGGEE